MTVPAARIREAVSLINPAVKESLDRVRVFRDAVRASPETHTRSARTRAERGWTRVVVEETVWSLAKAGLLNTPETAEVVKAAQAWVRTSPQDFFDDMDPEERALYDAVQVYAATLNSDQLDEVAVG